MDNQSAPWYRSIRKAAREWSGTYRLDFSIYPLPTVKADLFRDVCERHRDLLTPHPYSARALAEYQAKIIGDLWFVTKSDLRGVFKGKGYLVLPAADEVLKRWPRVTDVLMRIPDLWGDIPLEGEDAYYLDLFSDCLKLGLHRRIKLLENATRSVEEYEQLLAEVIAKLPPERRATKWSPKTFAA